MKILPLFAILFSSCVGTYSGLTGQPIPTTPVKRANVENAPTFNVATADVVRAETEPGKAWGLYNAGAVADAVGQVVESGK